MRLVDNEKGMALPLAVVVMLALAALVTAFLSLGALEPQISRNLVDATRARHVADAGIEFAYNRLTGTLNWSAELAASWPTGSAMPGLTTASGTYTVSIRNDNQAGDTQITGQPLDTGNNTTDTNRILIITSTGTFNGSTKTIRAVIRRTGLPGFPGAVNEPGMQTDTFAGGGNTNFSIDGRDWNRNGTLGAGSGLTNMKLGISTQSGTQANIAPTTYEQRVENAFSAAQLPNITGKKDNHCTSSCSGSTTGVDTIGQNDTLNPTVMQNFLNQVKAHPKTTILQSTQSCRMQLDSTGTPNLPTLTNGCGLNQALDLGSVTNPKLVYFRGDLDPTSQFTGLQLNGSQISGAGILIIEDGDFKNYASNFRWDGIVIVTGQYVGVGFMPGSGSTIYGSFTSMESIWNEASGFYEFYMNPASAMIRYSQQNLDMVQSMFALVRLYSVVEL
jgi:Tfp pilus assembly protein PilX